MCSREECAFFDSSSTVCPFSEDERDCARFISKHSLCDASIYVVFGYEDDRDDRRAVPLKFFFNKDDADEYAKWAWGGDTYVEPVQFSDGNDYNKIVSYIAHVWFTDEGHSEDVSVRIYRNDYCYYRHIYINVLEKFTYPSQYLVTCHENFDYKSVDHDVLQTMKERAEKVRDYVLANLGKKSLDEIREEIRYMK